MSRVGRQAGKQAKGGGGLHDKLCIQGIVASLTYSVIALQEKIHVPFNHLSLRKNAQRRRVNICQGISISNKNKENNKEKRR